MLLDRRLTCPSISLPYITDFSGIHRGQASQRDWRGLASYQACFLGTDGLSGRSAAYLVCRLCSELCWRHWGCRRATLQAEYRGWGFGTEGLGKRDVGLESVERRSA